MCRVLAAAAALLCTMAVATACSDESGGSTETKTIEITFADGDVSPSGERIEVDVDQPIDLVVTADAPGEIHMHTEPEQTFSYAEGTETFELQISQPGVVEVESHDLDKVIVQLEVS